MSTLDPQELKHFTTQSHLWWDEKGPFKSLHDINPVRLAFIRQEVIGHYQLDPSLRQPFQGLRSLDIGCGGGLLCEPLARLGATVLGIDAVPENIQVAQGHATKYGLDIAYEAIPVEDLVTTGKTFDIITALEIVEHVQDLPLFLKSCCRLVKPGGLLFLSTLNKTLRSYLLGIVAAEYILKWVPKGTHDWKKFLEPADIALLLEENGFFLANLKGITFNPFGRSWRLSEDLAVNYILSAKRL